MGKDCLLKKKEIELKIRTMKVGDEGHWQVSFFQVAPCPDPSALSLWGNRYS